ncbi:amino acid ABC transporter permease [Ktedonospora formicarum]|uniref:Amino acid ABC transporter permease n=1 Tax=Ktedonospora formicarum TaxID=2778364 RepID=A0A8J3MT43_9CHLR|nr:amino acid ABC transporter permease [Ktedonospora formicarum]GHO46780.1 amino acid ABC transporter permease [Ktedonospora formicarum]
MFKWNLVGFYLFQDPHLYFLNAAWLALWISVVAQAIGVVLGLLLALMQMSRFRALKWIAQAYIWFFRGSPLLVQVLLLWNGLPKLVPGLLLPDYACVLVAFSLNEGAYMSEITRAAIGAVDPGQMEAAKALGMRYWVAMRRIILPQAARVIIPPLGNEFNNMLKTTSIATVVGMMELTNFARTFGAPTFSIFELLIVATVYYLLLTTLWGFVQQWIERKLDPDRNQKFKVNKSFSQRTFGFGFGSNDQSLVKGGSR